jgi:Peptidase S46
MTKILKTTILIICISFIARVSFAGEGMWLPIFLKSLNEAEMQAMGMKLTAEDIYSVNHGSLKDAIVHFGGFCTSELISDQGLLLTNHHCGYGAIQSHTSLENNYLRDGFWAKSMKEELANPGLFATFIVRIDEVTEQILEGVTQGMTEKERQSAIDKNIAKLKGSVKLKSYEKYVVKPFFKGNQYFAILTMTYTDVRLVGAPPESIGKFGSDTDNWVWPRHTGDFSLFRIYAGADNLPAEYSENNVPYKPKHFLPISLDGVTQDDFTMVFGFPGRTNEYLPSFAIEQLVDVLNPSKIAIRDRALKIVDVEMRADPAIKIQYASKYARIANYWKKWIGESLGLKKTGAVQKKKDLEAEFTARISNNKAWSGEYGNLLNDFEKLYKELESYALTRDYYNEVVGRNIEIMRIAGYMRRLVAAYHENGESGYDDYKNRLSGRLDGFYKNYRPDIDQKVFAALMEMYAANAKFGTADPVKQELIMLGSNDYSVLAQDKFGKSAIPFQAKLYKILEASPEEAVQQLKADPLFQFSSTLADVYNDKVATKYSEINAELSTLQRKYMKALMEVFPEKRFYPDANSTMRFTYGKVASYTPRDAVTYTPVTYLDGIIEKYVPGDYEFDVPEKLINLYNEKDYGQYADNGKIPVCFLGTNHTTGGNSGSPAIDAHGNLVGLNFDRVWEGTMSDYNYDASICRNIMVDIRFVLFIIDKYAGASHLVEEMKLVHPKAN